MDDWSPPGARPVPGSGLPPPPPPPAGRDEEAPVAATPAEVPTRRVAGFSLIAGLLGALIGGGLVAALDRDPPTTPGGLDTAITSPVVEVPVEHDVDQVAAVAAAVLPTVVRIDVDGRGSMASGNGSGVVLSADGYIATNNHVVAGATELHVVFPDRSSSRAELVGVDETTDLAVVWVDRDDLVPIAVGDSSTLRVGQLAVAVGSPFGLEGSVTSGIISALDRPIDVTKPDGSPLRLPNVIQTDAEINPGNSGGPLVDSSGRLIGLNSAILTSGAPRNAGVGFAIPANTVMDVVDQLVAEGHVQHAYLGVSGTTLGADAADRLGLEGGAYVESVEPDTPAAEAGLVTGDVITAVDDIPVRTMDDLIVAIREAEIGQTVELRYVRDGQPATVSATLGELPG